MADIRLERQQRTIWPWVLVGLVILALLIWFFADRGPRIAEVDVDTAPAAAPTPVDPAPGPAGDFATWVADTDARAEDAHEYTADGVRQLADAIGDVADRELVREQPLGEQLDRMRAYADSMQGERDDQRQAGYARSAFLLGTELLEDIDRHTYPGVETQAGDTRSAAGMVDANVPLSEQLDRVERFFRSASNTVSRMAHARGLAEERAVDQRW